MNEYIKSPLNYTGNKYRIFGQIEKHFPKSIKCFVDMFCGGATVGLNVCAEKVYFIDKNKRVIQLLIFLAKQNFETLVSELEKVIEKYNLSYSYKYGYTKYREQCANTKDNNGLKDYNSKGFYELRNAYNALRDKSTDSANLLLYVLMVYGFNNDIRFNNDGMYNLPIGKTDLNRMNINKLKAYIEKINSMEAHFLCLDFSDDKLMEILEEADMVYMDPPYLLGDAVYNKDWNNKEEYRLLDFIDSLIDKKINFGLSNVLSKVGKENEPLAYWVHKNSTNVKVNNIEYHYRSASYNKTARDAKEQEVLISNRGYDSEDK